MCIAAGPERTIGTSAISMTPAGVRLAGGVAKPLCKACASGPAFVPGMAVRRDPTMIFYATGATLRQAHE